MECGAAWDAASSLLHLRHDALVFLEGNQKLRGAPVLINVRVLQVQLAGRVQLSPAELAERRVHPALVRGRQHLELVVDITEPEVAVALVCRQACGTCLLCCVSCACAQRHRSAVLDVASRVTDALPIHPRKGHRHMPAFVILTEQWPQLRPPQLDGLGALSASCDGVQLRLLGVAQAAGHTRDLRAARSLARHGLLQTAVRCNRHELQWLVLLSALLRVLRCHCRGLLLRLHCRVFLLQLHGRGQLLQLVCAEVAHRPVLNWDGLYVVLTALDVGTRVQRVLRVQQAQPHLNGPPGNRDRHRSRVPAWLPNPQWQVDHRAREHRRHEPESVLGNADCVTTVPDLSVPLALLVDADTLHNAGGKRKQLLLFPVTMPNLIHLVHRPHFERDPRQRGQHGIRDSDVLGQAFDDHVVVRRERVVLACCTALRAACARVGCTHGRDARVCCHDVEAPALCAVHESELRVLSPQLEQLAQVHSRRAGLGVRGRLGLHCRRRVLAVPLRLRLLRRLRVLQRRGRAGAGRACLRSSTPRRCSRRRCSGGLVVVVLLRRPPSTRAAGRAAGAAGRAAGATIRAAGATTRTAGATTPP